MKFVFVIWFIGIEIQHWLWISTKKYSLFSSSIRVFTLSARYLLSPDGTGTGVPRINPDANTRSAVIWII